MDQVFVLWFSLRDAHYDAYGAQRQSLKRPTLRLPFTQLNAHIVTCA